MSAAPLGGLPQLRDGGSIPDSMRADELKGMQEQAKAILGMEKAISSTEAAEEEKDSRPVFDPLGQGKPGFDEEVKVGGIFKAPTDSKPSPEKKPQGD